MAFFNCNFHSDILGMACSMNVIVPQQSPTRIGMDSKGGRATYPILYLLHGLGDDHTIWARRTSIERYVADMNLIVVMPATHRGFYTDMDAGAKYWTFISEELPAVVKGFFPVDGRREDTFAAGLSMGGYGALKLGLRCPGKFAAVAGLSSVTDVRAFMGLNSEDPDFSREMQRIFGSANKVESSENDLFRLASELAGSKEPQPAIFQCCGTEDFLYQDNLKFRDHLKKLKMNLHYQEAPGDHNWNFWDQYIQDVLKWLPLPK
jgi:S-formylglutathione hydrolase FrmB